MKEKPNLIPIIRELPADLDTPVSVYLKLAGDGPSFLLESITGGEQIARYSFIGVNPRRAYVLQNGRFTTHYLASGKPSISEDATDDPLAFLRQQMADINMAESEALPRFAGGLVGYFGYEMMRYFEPSTGLPPHEQLPDAILLQADTLVAFDHAYGRLLLIANAYDGDEADAIARLDKMEAKLQKSLPFTQNAGGNDGDALTSNFTQDEYETAVSQGKEHILAGDIFQVVLSQQFSRQTNAKPFDIYRSLRRLNPSPYMFFFDFDELGVGEPFHLLGASPEMHARFEDGIAAVRPIAGTRARGKTAVEDAALEDELLADPKELAEHVMLIDLGRNDLGRVCDYGTVQVTEQMVVERYSHVMHIVSHVEGRLRSELDAFDLLRGTFPAGTVSGAPKIRAMQIINAMEPSPRGPYAGAVGYISYDGSMDTCIAIRTLSMIGDTVTVQAGAGIVADSDPTSEFIETTNKAGAVAEAVRNAE